MFECIQRNLPQELPAVSASRALLVDVFLDIDATKTSIALIEGCKSEGIFPSERS